MCIANLKSIIYILSRHVEKYIPEIDDHLSSYLVFDAEDTGIRGRKRMRMREH